MRPKISPHTKKDVLQYAYLFLGNEAGPAPRFLETVSNGQVGSQGVSLSFSQYLLWHCKSKWQIRLQGHSMVNTQDI